MKSISSSNEFKKSKIKVKMENDIEYEIETKNDIEYDIIEKELIKYMISITKVMFQVVKEERV